VLVNYTQLFHSYYTTVACGPVAGERNIKPTSKYCHCGELIAAGFVLEMPELSLRLHTVIQAVDVCMRRV
jgi:hypothetical protein